MSPATFQSAPAAAPETLHNVVGGPPSTSIFLSLPLGPTPAKNPMLRLSGDQNGAKASSVPARGCAVSAFSDRTHNMRRRSAPEPMNARRVPSGDTANRRDGD